MATRNTSYAGASTTQKDAEALESSAKDTHSVSKRYLWTAVIKCESESKKFTTWYKKSAYMQNRVPNSQRYLVVGLVGLVG